MAGGWRMVFRLDRGKGQIARDVDDEIAFHLEARVAKLTAEGIDPQEARRRAEESFGDLSGVRRECLTIDRQRARNRWWSDFGQGVLQDARYAVRMLAREPAFSGTVILLLAVGIGANTAIFSLVDALFLRPLSVPHAEQLITIGDPSRTDDGWSGSPRTDYVSYPVYKDLRTQNHVLSGIYATGVAGDLEVASDSGAGGALDRPRGRLVSGSFFDVLQVPPLIGRTITDDDDRAPIGTAVAVISYGYWQRHFGGAPSVPGSTVRINGTPVTIIGVMPPTFTGDIVGDRIDLWMPLWMQPLMWKLPSWLAGRDKSWLLMMGRRAPGVTLAQARTELVDLELRSIRSQLSGIHLQRFDEDLRTTPVRVDAGSRGFSPYRPAYGPALAVLLASVALLIILVSGNVANLLLARAVARRREMTVRISLGAGRRRLIRQLLTESALLAAMGGAFGLLVAYWGSHLLLVMASRTPVAIALDVALNGRILAFTAAVTLGTVLLFGLFPATRATRVDLATTLRAQGRNLAGVSERAGRVTIGRTLVGAQVALSALLLLGSALLTRSMQRILTVDLGLDRDRLLTVDLSVHRAGYEGPRVGILAQELLDRFRVVPGVKAVALSENGLFSGSSSRNHIEVPGYAATADSEGEVSEDAVGAGFFHTLGARLVRGRDFEPTDRASAARVAVINRTMARFYFGSADAIGRTIVRDSIAYTIVGVVNDIASQDVRALPARWLYLSLPQANPSPTHFTVVLQTAGDPSRLAGPARATIQSVNPHLVADIEPLNDLVRASVAQDLLVTRVTTMFGLLALLLAALGLYGVVSYATNRRVGEFGLRMALGATSGTVLRLVLGEAITVAGAGILVGVPVAVLAMDLLRQRLFEISTLDPTSMAAATALLMLTALIAGYVPARRASKVAPLAALRE